MSESLTLADIERRTNVPMVRLRYIADSEILPGNRIQMQAAPRRPGRGVTRIFTPCEAFGMVIALQLLDAGIRRETVSRIMDLLGKRIVGSRDPNDIPLVQALFHPAVQGLEIGDGLNIQFHGDPPKLPNAIFRDWVQIETGAKLRAYEPLVSVRINIGKLRRLIR